mgnify:CR=1 FL=1
MTDTPTNPGVVLLRCTDCNTRATAQLAHLDNILAAGPWRCEDHDDRTTP